MAKQAPKFSQTKTTVKLAPRELQPACTKIKLVTSYMKYIEQRFDDNYQPFSDLYNRTRQ